MTVYTWAQLQRLMDRYVDTMPVRRWAPWLFPDPNPFPRISLFPRLDRFTRRSRP